MHQFIHGNVPALSNDANEARLSEQILARLREVRQQDAPTFDALLGGQTQDPQLVQAYIDHENGRRYSRGLRPMANLTALERQSMGLALSPSQFAEMMRRDERVAMSRSLREM